MDLVIIDLLSSLIMEKYPLNQLLILNFIKIFIFLSISINHLFINHHVFILLFID